MKGILPECCKEFQITNRDELIDCMNALESAISMTIDALEEQLTNINKLHDFDHKIMFIGDDGLNGIYDRIRLKIKIRINELRTTTNG